MGMTRVTEQSSGTYYVQSPDGTAIYYDTIEHMPEPLRDSMRLLHAMDAGTGISGIGRRMTDMSYWVYDGDEDSAKVEVLWQARWWIRHAVKSHVNVRK